MTDHPGQQLGNYRIIRLLGQGGFAEVYLGVHVHLKTQGAIKILKGQITLQDQQNFLKEAQTIAALKHPHILRVLEFGFEHTTPFLVMDYAPMGTLRERYPHGVLVPLTTVISYAKQVGSALQYVHTSQLIHRDVKPENMLMVDSQTVLLSDFGIATMAHSTSSLQTQNTIGTIRYMAPEQIQGKPCPASDQYALGITVYEWLCGTQPFTGSSFVEIAMHHISDVPPPLREKIPGISPQIEQVVSISLAKTPQQRFASVEDFVTALEQAYQSTLPPLNSSFSPAAIPSLSSVSFTQPAPYHIEQNTVSKNQPYPVRSFNGQRLHGTNFQGYDLQGVIFLNCDLSSADFRDADVQGASFSGSNLASAIFLGCDLSGIDFQGLELQNAIFERTKLHGTNFSHARLDSADFRFANVQDANFSGAILKDALF